MNALVPIGIVALFLTGKSLEKKLERITVAAIHIKPGAISFNEVLLKVTLDIYNPNSTSLNFNFFNGYIYRAGIRLGRFEVTDTTKIVGHNTTPVSFNVRITTVGVVSNLFNILKNITQHTAADLTFSIDGLLNVGGFDLPVKYSYNLKSAVSGIGKPYAKFEFNSNEEMANYLRKPCADTKFSLNG